MIYGIFQYFESQEFANILWMIAIALLYFCFLCFIIAAWKSDLKSRRMVYVGYGLFSLCFGFTRLFFLMGWYCYGDQACVDFLNVFGYVTGTAGIIFIIFVMETYLLKTKKILTLITVILFGIILVALAGLTARETALTMIYILLPFALGAVAISYVYFIIKSTGTSRNKAIGAFLGMILIFLGHFMNARLFASYFPEVPLYVSPIVMILGVILFIYSQLQNVSKS